MGQSKMTELKPKPQNLNRVVQDNMAKLEALVLKHKDDLWWYWTHLDPENTNKVEDLGFGI